MPLDPAVRDVLASQRPRFGPHMEVVTEYVYTFYVGKHGPFTERFGVGEHHTEAVERRLNEVARKLRELGMLT